MITGKHLVKKTKSAVVNAECWSSFVTNVGKMSTHGDRERKMENQASTVGLISAEIQATRFKVSINNATTKTDFHGFIPTSDKNRDYYLVLRKNVICRM